MAKVKLGAIVVDMSGKLGGHVFAKNRGGNYMRTKTTPTNPQTSYQTNVRAIFASISSSWSGLSESQRGSFRSKVSEFARTNVFGDLKNPTGKALFQRLNQNLVLTGQNQIVTAPAPKEVKSLGNVTAVLDEGVTFNVTSDKDTTGEKIMYYATPPLSAGTKFVKNKLRLLEVSTGGVNKVTDILASYSARFTAPFVDTTVAIYIAVRTVNSQGQASPLQTVKMVGV